MRRIGPVNVIKFLLGACSSETVNVSMEIKAIYIFTN